MCFFTKINCKVEITLNISVKITKQTRVKRCEAMLLAGIQNLLVSQDVFTLETFTVKVLDILMLLEREAYLKGSSGSENIGNESCSRSFKALNKNSLLLHILRIRSGYFNPMTLALLKTQ